jgi:hypothetical protein
MSPFSDAETLPQENSMVGRVGLLHGCRIHDCGSDLTASQTIPSEIPSPRTKPTRRAFCLAPGCHAQTSQLSISRSHKRFRQGASADVKPRLFNRWLNHILAARTSACWIAVVASTSR